MLEPEFRETLLPLIFAQFRATTRFFHRLSDDDKRETMAAWYEVLRPLAIAAAADGVAILAKQAKRIDFDSLPGKLLEAGYQAMRNRQVQNHEADYARFGGPTVRCQFCRDTGWVDIAESDPSRTNRIRSAVKRCFCPAGDSRTARIRSGDHWATINVFNADCDTLWMDHVIAKGKKPTQKVQTPW